MRPLEEQRAELLGRKCEIEERLRKIDAKAMTERRKIDTRRKVIVGALVLGAAEATGAHRQWLLAVLHAAPSRTQDQEIITGLIAELEGMGKEKDGGDDGGTIPE